MLCTSEFADAVDRGCPMILGGPLAHVMAAKAVAFHEALAPSFRDYAAAIVANARALAEAIVAAARCCRPAGPTTICCWWTCARTALTAANKEALRAVPHILLNRNILPYDPNGPWFTSGIRLGTAALTTRGLARRR